MEGKEKWYDIFRQYLLQHCRTAFMFLLYTVIFAGVFSLYDLELEAVWYASVLCLFVTMAVLAVSFFFYRERHEKRRKITRNVLLMFDELPEPQNLVEEDYQEMLRSLRHILDDSLTSWQNERRDSIDYYTTWVHEIKTPISVMRMTLQGEDTEEHRGLLAELFRIESYVEMVLSYLRLGNGSSDFLFREYELDGIIRQALHKYAPLFIKKRIGLSYEKTDCVVLTDEKWLLFMIEQVLSNAVKYTQEGMVAITVTEDSVLQIEDTGIGIAPEDIPRIFEKGFTGYNGRADKKSTGLGLYLCRMAAEKLSHKLSVQSVVGKGTVFSIDLKTDRLEVE